MLGCFICNYQNFTLDNAHCRTWGTMNDFCFQAHVLLICGYTTAQLYWYLNINIVVRWHSWAKLYANECDSSPWQHEQDRTHHFRDSSKCPFSWGFPPYLFVNDDFNDLNIFDKQVDAYLPMTFLSKDMQVEKRGKHSFSMWVDPFPVRIPGVDFRLWFVSWNVISWWRRWWL